MCGGSAPCFQWIQDGVDESENDVVIKVEGGSYPENILIDGGAAVEIGWDDAPGAAGSTGPVILKGPLP